MDRTYLEKGLSVLPKNQSNIYTNIVCFDYSDIGLICKGTVWL